MELNELWRKTFSSASLVACAGRNLLKLARFMAALWASVKRINSALSTQVEAF